MAQQFTNFNKIESGEDVTIIFTGTKLPLQCSIRQYDARTQSLVVTTPPGETDPALQKTHYIKDFQEVRQGLQIGFGETFPVELGDVVRVYFGTECCDPQPVVTPRSLAFQLSEDPFNDNEYAYVGRSQTGPTTGIIIPEEGVVTTVTISRESGNDSVDLLVNNVTTATFAVTQDNEVFSLNVPVVAGDFVTLRKQGGQNIREFVGTIIWQATDMPAPPPTANGLVQVEGTVFEINPDFNTFLILTTGGDRYVIKDYWYLEKL